jgi:hypothetical protein
MLLIPWICGDSDPRREKEFPAIKPLLGSLQLRRMREPDLPI